MIKVKLIKDGWALGENRELVHMACRKCPNYRFRPITDDGSEKCFQCNKQAPEFILNFFRLMKVA